MNFLRAFFRCVSLAFVAVFAGCGPSGTSLGTAPPPPPVTVAPVPQQPARAATQLSGRLAAAQSVEVRARVGGIVDRVEFVEGMRVRQGQVLFRIDPRPYRAEAERQLAARKRALVELDLAKANRARAQRLGGDQALSPEESERLASADRDAASALAAANAALSAAKLDLQFTEVRAPIDGRASRALITQGTAVSSDSLLTTVVSDDPLYASVDADGQSSADASVLAMRGEHYTRK